MIAVDLFPKLGISLLLGLLVGLQREHAGSGRSGMRTFPLITVFGTLSAILATTYGGWVLAGGLLAVVTVLASARLIALRDEHPDPGTTTDIAVLVMYGVGASLMVAPMEIAIAIGGGVAVLLQFKPELHRIVEKLGNEDLKAIMQFVLITCIILPVLPDQCYGPLHVFNPWKTWLMVVLIVGMSLGGYIVYKFLGRDAGIVLGGILGGAISSTATTVSYSRQSRGQPRSTQVATIVVMIASTVVFVRVLIEIAVVAPDFLAVAGMPVVVLMVLTMIPSLVLWHRVRRRPSLMPEQENPTQLRSALLFAAMYAVVLIGLAAAKQYVGNQGMYAVAALSGLTDMDAITLSTAGMAATDRAVFENGWRLLVIAAMANLVFKAGLIATLGGGRLLRKILPLFAIPLAGGVLLLIYWPLYLPW